MQEVTTSMQHQKLGYSVNELSQLTGICERKLWDEIKAGRLKAARFGRRVVVASREADKWLSEAANQPYEPINTGTAKRKAA